MIDEMFGCEETQRNYSTMSVNKEKVIQKMKISSIAYLSDLTKYCVYSVTNELWISRRILMSDERIPF